MFQFTERIKDSFRFKRLLCLPKTNHITVYKNSPSNLRKHIEEVGYQHGKTVFDVWCRSGVVEKMLKDRRQEEFYNTNRNNMVTCPNASFTDLAEIVSRIEPVKQALMDEESDYHTDYEEEQVGSALSDIEPTHHCSEHTEEELTADTDEELERVHNHLNSEDSSGVCSFQPQHTASPHNSQALRARKVCQD